MTLAGVWQNEYGSRMDLGLMNSNLIMGTYTSSTGSSGTYMVIGYQQTGEPSMSAGQPAALAIDWHSIVAGPSDNSWHWVSGLSGQLSIQNGVEQLVLAHALVASIEFPGLVAAGTYIDKLIYTRSSEQSVLTPETIATGRELDNPLVGNWFAPDGTALFIQSVVPYTNNIFGWVMGKMRWRGAPSMIYGVTDVNASSDGLNLQSVSIVGLPSYAGEPAISYSGTLDLSSGTLTLLNLSSQATAPGSTYIQTSASTLAFTKS